MVLGLEQCLLQFLGAGEVKQSMLIQSGVDLLRLLGPWSLSTLLLLDPPLLEASTSLTVPRKDTQNPFQRKM